MKLLDFLDPSKPVCIDVETIRNVDGLSPYHGDKIAGMAIAQGEEAIYLPLRHRTELDLCLPFEDTLAEVRAFASRMECYRNLNVKFDLHFLANDGVLFPRARYEDTGTLARLVQNRLPDFDLESLTNRFCTKYKKAPGPVEDWLKSNNSNDYGAVPISIMARYARLDALSALELHTTLLGLLADETKEAWEDEVKFCRKLWRSERRGVKSDPEYFEMISAVLCKKLLKTQERLNENIGWQDNAGRVIEFNPASWKQKNDFFTSKGIAPVSWNTSEKTGKKNPCWDGDAISQLFVEDDKGTNLEAKKLNQIIADMIAYGEAKTAHSTFCVGWMERRDAEDILHTHYNSGGCKTGRLSSSNPNLQNPPPWAMKGLLIPEGWIGVKYDYSQIEYRIFAHFAKDPELIRLYQENPHIDFHQIVAERLGMGKYRNTIKPINFGILYGMGQKKLVRQLAKTIHDLNDPDLMEFLQCKYGGRTGGLLEIATNILAEYHQLVPAVKTLLKEVKVAIHAKGYIRDFNKRHLQFTEDLAYVALNYLCQGSAASIFKNRTNAVFDDPMTINSGAEFSMNIHDAILADVPSIQGAQDYWEVIKKEATNVPRLKVQLLVDGEVAIGNWSNTINIFDKKEKRERTVAECVELLKQGQSDGKEKWLKAVKGLYVDTLK